MSDGADPHGRARLIKLPLLRILLGAFTLPGRHFAAVARVAAMPMLAVIACSLVFHAVTPGSAATAWAMYAVYALALCWLALSLHRLVLAADDPAGADARRNLLRLTIFFAFFAAYLCLRFLVPILIASGYALTQMKSSPPATAPPPVVPLPGWVTALAWIATFWISGRILLVFPAIAVDRSPSLVTAWRLSRGNGWRLAIIAALPWALQKAVSLLWREGGTYTEFGILVVLTAATTIFTVVALSLSYWELTSPAAPPSEPPA